MHVVIDDHELVVDLGDDRVLHLPIGLAQLRADELLSDPPRPEELTNAIGLVYDHMDDVVRADASVMGAATTVAGPHLRSIVSVEVGALAELPFVLDRDAAEDVFRTLATEAAADRRHNPGLPAEHVDTVVSACCAVVAIMRRLQLADVTVVPHTGSAA